MIDTSTKNLAGLNLSGRLARINIKLWVTNFFRLVAVTMGAVHTWAASAVHSMNPDGINYLDMGDAYLRGDWAMALNSVWSPLYSWVLGLMIRVFKPGMRWEFPAVHITNFFIFLVALICFEYFMRQLVEQVRQERKTEQDEIETKIPEWGLIGIGYSLFIWTSLSLIKIWAVNPDMLVSAVVYLAAGLVLHINYINNSWKMHALLGIVLGAGFLAKAAMLPIAFSILAAAIVSSKNRGRAVPKLLFSLIIFALISLSFIGAVSSVKGRVTYGDTGWLTYIRHVNGIPYPHWQGEVPGYGTPVNPSRKIFAKPPIYEFGTPIEGTYPISYDSSYWYAGVIPSYKIRDLSAALGAGGMYYFDLFFRQQAALVSAVLILYLMMPWRSSELRKIISSRGLIVIALSAFILYALVYVEGRYIAPFVVILWADLLAGVRLPVSGRSARLGQVVSAVMILFIMGNLLFFNLNEMGAFNSRVNSQGVSQSSSPPSWPGEVAQKLRDLGIEPGSKVGVIGYAFDSYWARLARVKIVAEMLSWDAYPFWLGDAEIQSDVVQAFRSAGVQAVVAEKVPDFINPVGWHQVGQSNYYIYLINQ